VSTRLHCAIMALAAGTAGIAVPAVSQVPRGANACIAHAPEAATRSGLPRDIIERVMMAESGGDDHAISPKGAMGCMQIMPATWAMLTARYALGSNPYDARASMIAGSLYLAELARRHGFPGAYAAYNAGEARWLRHRDSGEPLPAVTVAYMARLDRGARSASVEAPRPRWQEAGLFLVREGDRPAQDADGNTSGPSAMPTQPGWARPTSPPTLFPLSRPTLTKSE